MQQLMEAAINARKYAYAPYSDFQVGAAVLTVDGEIFSGCNIENASYGLTTCAERTAIFQAVANGKQQFSVLAVVADTNRPVIPCGACLQVMVEFNIPKVILGNLKGDTLELSLNELLPYQFK